MSTLVVIAAIVVIVILIITVFFLVVAKMKQAPASGWQSEIKQRMENIARHINPQNPQTLKLAILEYDKLAELVLNKLQVPGGNMGEKMKAAKKYFPERNVYETFWHVHKLRNTIAHELNYNPTADDLMQNCIYYRQVITYLIRS